MVEARAARSKIYDGAVYGRLLDPLLEGVHGYVVDHLPPGPRVIDACCGTGALARSFARAGRCVLGVDLSPRNIAYARRAAETEGFADGALTFEVVDVATLRVPDEGPYDVGTVVLALHEMPRRFRVPVLRALLRVTRTLMIVDYAIPMPRNLAGLRNRALELAAGYEHFAGFRSFTRDGGLPALLDSVGAEVLERRVIDSRTLEVALVRASP